MNREQMRAILWLRWRLTRNQLLRGRRLGAAIAAVVAVFAVMAVVACGLGGTLVGALALKKATGVTLMFVWDGVTFFFLLSWVISVLVELQRSETIDLTRLMHLPVALKDVFFLNYLASHLSLGMTITLPLMLGLAVGLIIGRGLWMALLVPLVLCFVFMISAWVYCLRGWLVTLMVNKRRRRAIIVYATLAVVLLGQTPNLVNMVVQGRLRAARQRQTQTAKGAPTNSVENATPKGRRQGRFDAETERQFLAVATRAHGWVPFLWLANGARGLAAGEPWPALWGGAAAFGLGWLGLRRAYRSTLRFYLGGEGNVAVAKPKLAEVSGKRAGRNWVEWRLPGLPEDTAALALAQLRSISRAPEIKMLLATNVFMAVFLPAMIFLKGGARMPEAGKPFVATGAVAMVMFGLIQLACNQFGHDRDGFRGLVLLPTPRHRLLLGKNLALLPIAAGMGAFFLLAVTVLAKLSLVLLLAGLLQFSAVFVLVCVGGNLTSVLAPYRVAAGSLKPTKLPVTKTLLVLGVHLLFLLAIFPLFIPPALGWGLELLGWLPAAWVNLTVSAILAALAAWLYRLVLPPTGRLLQRRETEILRAVTAVTE